MLFTDLQFLALPASGYLVDVNAHRSAVNVKLSESWAVFEIKTPASLNALLNKSNDRNERQINCV